MADNAQPKSTLPWLPQSNVDYAAQIAADQQRMNRAAILATQGTVQPPFPPPVPSPAHADPEAPSIIGQRNTPLPLRAAAITEQEQPDHPRSHTSPSVPDPLPVEPASRPLPAQRGRDGGIMFEDGSVVYPDASAEPTAGTAPTSVSSGFEVGIAAATVLGTTLAVTLPSSGVTPAVGPVPPMPAALRPTILGQPALDPSIQDGRVSDIATPPLAADTAPMLPPEPRSAGAGGYIVSGSDASMSVTLVTKGVKARPAARTKIGRAVLKKCCRD